MTHAPLAAIVTLAFAFSAARAAEAPNTSAPERKPYTRNVAIVLYEGVEILDFGGPSEVFKAAANFGASGTVPAFRVYTVAASHDAITSQGFIKILPEFTFEEAPKPDLIVFPGGDSSALTGNPRAMAWAKKVMGESEVTLTVCTGAFVPAKAGLLDGLTVTTFYNAIDGLKREAPKANVEHGRRFVDNGRIVTTAGVSAGIDGALHVVARLLGRDVADKTARYMEYHWTPEPYLAREYAWLNPSLDVEGRAMQQATILEDSKDFEGAASAWRAIVEKHAGNSFAWYRLGFTLQSLGRYDDAIAAAMKAAESPDVRGKALYNVACARARQGKKPEALDALSKAVDAGFDQGWLIATDPDLDPLRKEPGFQQIAERI